MRPCGAWGSAGGVDDVVSLRLEAGNGVEDDAHDGGAGDLVVEAVVG